MPDGAPDVGQVVADPDFKGLSLGDKNAVLMKIDPDFSGLPPAERVKALTVIHYGMPPQGEAPQQEGFFKSISTALSPTQDVRDLYRGPLQALQHPLESGKMILGALGQSQAVPLERAKQAFKAKNYGRAASETINFALPFVGPLLSKASQQGDVGNYAGMAGTTLGAALPFVVGSPEARATLGRVRELGAPIAGRTAQSIVGASPKNLPPVSEPAPAMVAEGPIAFSERGLAKNLGQRVAEYDATVQNTLQKYEGQPPEPIQPIVDKAVGPMIESAKKAGLQTRANAIQTWRDNFLAEQPKEMSLKELYGLRQDLKNSAGLFKKSAANPDEVSIGNAMEQAYRSMNDALDQRIRGIKQYTQRESGLIRGKEMIENKLRIAAGKPLSPRLGEYLVSGGENIYGGASVHLNVPGGILPKTLMMKLFGNRTPLPALPEPPVTGALPDVAGYYRGALPPVGGFREPSYTMTGPGAEPIVPYTGRRITRGLLGSGEGARPITEPSRMLPPGKFDEMFPPAAQKGSKSLGNIEPIAQGGPLEFRPGKQEVPIEAPRIKTLGGAGPLRQATPSLIDYDQWAQAVKGTAEKLGEKRARENMGAFKSQQTAPSKEISEAQTDLRAAERYARESGTPRAQRALVRAQRHLELMRNKKQ